ncbi:MAG: hypothetical protein ACREEW_05530 [Caulobacteraceae bacterium]
MPLVETQQLKTTADVTQAVIAVARQFGFTPVETNEFPVVGEMAARLMKHEVASCETFQTVQAIQPGSSLCFREDGAITGITGLLLLREVAVAGLLAGEFDGVAVDADLLSRPGEGPAIGYGWGIAATTKTAGAAITALSMPLRLGPLGGLSFVTKAVTGAGRHVAITRMGYQPLRHPDDDLLVSWAEAQRRAA